MQFLPASTAVLLALACTAALAAPPAPEANAPVSKGEIKAMRDFKLLDFNGDGKISRTEVALFPRLAAAFDEADTNHDNYLSFDEVRAFAVRYRAERDRLRAEQQAQRPAPQEANGAHGADGALQPQAPRPESETPKPSTPP